MKVPGRTHPVEVFYTAKPEPNYVEAAIRTTLHIHECEGPGDILVFLTGEQEIEQACEEIREKASGLGKDMPELVVYPLYASLTPSQQRLIFTPAPEPRVPGGPPGRKVVVSTNIAETSLTIDGIVCKLPSGSHSTSCESNPPCSHFLTYCMSVQTSWIRAFPNKRSTIPASVWSLFWYRPFHEQVQGNGLVVRVEHGPESAIDSIQKRAFLKTFKRQPIRRFYVPR